MFEYRISSRILSYVHVKFVLAFLYFVHNIEQLIISVTTVDLLRLSSRRKTLIEEENNLSLEKQLIIQ